jgi:hypothetical protein
MLLRHTLLPKSKTLRNLFPFPFIIQKFVQVTSTTVINQLLGALIKKDEEKE